MLPSGATSTSFGSVNFAGGSPASPGVPSVSSTLPCGLNFITVWPLPFGVGKLLELLRRRRPRIGDPDVALAVDVHAVRPQDLSRAEALHDLAVRIELDDRVDVRTGARVGAAAIAGPDVLAVGIDVDGADRSPLAAVRQRAPVAHGLVGIRQVVDRRDLGVLGRTRRSTRRPAGCGGPAAAGRLLRRARRRSLRQADDGHRALHESSPGTVLIKSRRFLCATIAHLSNALRIAIGLPSPASVLVGLQI